MPVPKQRKTKSRRNQRRSHHALKKLVLTKCPKCGYPILPHTICLNCGTYKGREFIDIFKKMSKRERKKKQKELSEQEAEKSKSAAAQGLSLEELSKNK